MSKQPVLFIAPTRIGDAVLAASILRYISESQPDARVTIATSPLAAPLYAGYPQLEKIIEVTKRTYNRHWLALWRATFATRWHTMWDLRNSILSVLLRTKTRYGYSSQAAAPKVKQYEKAFGISPLPYPILWPRAQDIAAAEALMPTSGKYIIFAPMANWEPKEWPLQSFIELAQALFLGQGAGYRPVIVCAAHERARVAPMLEALSAFSPVDLTAGDLPLLTIYACMQRAQAFVGNDSGLMHMAAAASIPTLGIFGPTSREVYQPWGEKTQTVFAADGNIKNLPVSTVLAELAQLL